MKERIVVVFIAIAIGLVATTLVFFLYQQTKTLPNTVVTKNNTISPTPEDKKSSILTVDSPANESISDKRSIVVKGKTDPAATVVVSTNQEDSVVKPTADGKFSVTIAIDAGANKVITRAIMPNGESATDTRIITYSTEDF